MAIYQTPVSGKLPFLLLFTFLIQCVFFTSASVLQFESSPSSVKQGLTNSLTLNCSVSDSALSGAVIGRRDVSHTQENMLMLTSLVVMKNGSDIASVNLATPAHIVDGSTNVQVIGGVAGTAGYITLTFTDPKVNQIGEFVCEAHGLGATGHGVTLTTKVQVTSVEPSIADLVTFVTDLRSKNDHMAEENLKLKQMNEDLRHDFNLMINKSQQMVYFNARMLTNRHYSVGQVVVFDNIVESQGSGYNKYNGLFTCSVPGYYHFTLGCMSDNGKLINMKLVHNQQELFRIYGAAGYSHQTGANAGTVRLAGGDVVKVQTVDDTTVVGLYCSFHGFLIQAL